jgi:sugar/nucleoside kinase (ribokinase family)
MGVFVGLTTLDVIHHVDAVPSANQKITAHMQVVAAGGPATNAAVTFAALGGEATLITALGQSAVAEVIRADLEACRVGLVDVAPPHVNPAPVSAVAVLTGTGERSVVSVDAGRTVLDTVPDLSAPLHSTDIALVDGHHPLLAEEASRVANASSVPLVVDAGRWKSVMSVLIPRASAVVSSADFRYPGTDDAESSARALLRLNVPTLIVTQGSDPVRWWQGGWSGSVAPPQVQVVDTSGAGDVFHGAYCYFAASGDYLDVGSRISAACRIAALKCAYFGTRTWLRHLPDLATVREALRSD